MAVGDCSLQRNHLRAIIGIAHSRHEGKETGLNAFDAEALRSFREANFFQNLAMHSKYLEQKDIRWLEG